jgi:hypothetical protein
MRGGAESEIVLESMNLKMRGKGEVVILLEL